MKISDIKDPELKALAIKRMKEQNVLYEMFGENVSIDGAFRWGETEEGHTFWRNIDKQVTESVTLNQYQSLYDLMSKEHYLSLTISEMDEIITTCLKVKELIDAI
jgi:hypothetical protein